jgi:predicted ATPase
MASERGVGVLRRLFSHARADGFVRGLAPWAGRAAQLLRTALAFASGAKGRSRAVIERVHIDNFRCLSGFKLRLDRVNLLVGPNGSGKSSLVAALAGIAASVGTGTPIRELFVPDDLTRWDARTEQRFELDVRLDSARFDYLLRIEHDRESRETVIVEERVEREGWPLFAYRDGQVHLHRDDGSPIASFPFRGLRSFLPEVEAGPENRLLLRFLGYMKDIRALKLILSQIRSVTHDEHPRLQLPGDNFASWYRYLARERPGDLHELFEDLGSALPGFRSLLLVGAGKQGHTRDLLARFESPGGGRHELELEALSDGQRALIVLYSLLADLRGNPRLMLLEEPERFVGITEIQPWLRALDDALGNNGQLVLVSHHPVVIDSLAGTRPLLFERTDGGPTRVRTEIFAPGHRLRASDQLLRGLEP